MGYTPIFLKYSKDKKTIVSLSCVILVLVSFLASFQEKTSKDREDKMTQTFILYGFTAKKQQRQND
jgi:hypothetical protein